MSAVVLGVLAVVAIAAQQGVITPPFTPAPVEEPVERLESVAPSAAPLTIETRPPEIVAAQVAAPTATPNQTASPTNTPAAPVIASEVVATHTSTAALVAVSTATAPSRLCRPPGLRHLHPPLRLLRRPHRPAHRRRHLCPTSCLSWTQRRRSKATGPMERQMSAWSLPCATRAASRLRQVSR